jgi:hypothetical protein
MNEEFNNGLEAAAKLIEEKCGNFKCDICPGSDFAGMIRELKLGPHDHTREIECHGCFAKHRHCDCIIPDALPTDDWYMRKQMAEGHYHTECLQTSVDVGPDRNAKIQQLSIWEWEKKLLEKSYGCLIANNVFPDKLDCAMMQARIAMLGTLVREAKLELKI